MSKFKKKVQVEIQLNSVGVAIVTLFKCQIWGLKGQIEMQFCDDPGPNNGVDTK